MRTYLLSRPSRFAVFITIALLGVSCAAQQALRQDLLDIEAEHRSAVDLLAASPAAAALLDIVRYQDARTGSVEIAAWAAHPDPTVRAAAYRGLGLVGGPVARARLVGGLSDSDAAVRQSAAFGLAQVWAWPMAELLARQIHEELALVLDPLAAGEDAPFVALARSELYLAEAPDWDQVLDGDGSPSYLFIALGLLCKTSRRAGEDLPVLGALQPASLDVASVSGLLYALAQCGPPRDQIGDPELVSWLVERASAEDEDGAVSAWRALGRFESALVIDILRSGLADAKTARRRLAALRSLGQLGPPGEVELLGALSLDDPLLASQAAVALSRSENPELWGLLVDLLGKDGAASGPVALARLEALISLSARSAPPQDEFVRSEFSVPKQVVASAEGSDELVLRRAGFSLSLCLAVAGGDAETLSLLLEQSEGSDDTGLPVVAAIVLASRNEDLVEGALLERLDSDDLLVAGIAAAALGDREGNHITERLVTAYGKASGPEKWALREALAVALLARPGLPPAAVIQMRDDPSAAVRLAVYRHAISAEERVDLGPVPQSLPIRDLPDASFGVGNVRGARIVTSRGTLELVLFPDLAPGAVANFVDLAERGFYSELLFHRVVPDFVVQAGDPTGTGWGGPGYSVRDEFSSRPFLRGSLGMARSDKDTAGSQWFITHSRQPHLDRHYTLFGQLSGGWKVLDGISVGDRIESITIDRISP